MVLEMQTGVTSDKTHKPNSVKEHTRIVQDMRYRVSAHNASRRCLPAVSFELLRVLIRTSSSKILPSDSCKSSQACCRTRGTCTQLSLHRESGPTAQVLASSLRKAFEVLPSRHSSLSPKYMQQQCLVATAAHYARNQTNTINISLPSSSTRTHTHTDTHTHTRTRTHRHTHTHTHTRTHADTRTHTRTHHISMQAMHTNTP